MSATSASSRKFAEVPVRVPPHSMEAERAVLGGLMLDNNTWERIADRLHEEDFYHQDNRLIFRAISELSNAGQPFDAVTMSEWLQSRNQLDDAGGLAYLATLARDTPTAANVRAYAEIVRERAELRHLIQLSTDLADAAHAPGERKAVDISKQFESQIVQQAQIDGGLRVFGVGEFLSRELPPRETLLAPWLPSQGLCMIYSPRGTGKTHVALGVAFALATGGQFLRWQAPHPTGVLFVDGELPANVLQARVATLVSNSAAAVGAPLDILTPDFQPHGIPDLGTERGQAVLDAVVKPDHRVLILDNLSALVRSGKENEGESWLPVQSWALRQRAAGRSVLFIHHAGKGGQQRGSSRREDLLDTVIALRLPPDYSPQDGAKFEVHFEKARMLCGNVVKPFEATLQADSGGCAVWTTKDLDDTTFDRVVILANDGLVQADIAAELGIHKSSVSRHLKRARSEGLVAGATPHKPPEVQP